ncbi:hypothetical protein [Actinomadura macra]|uniref:hypothetical protein n=1 Tax=Actinomadura macra TaxID=46164 RepID=UPI00082B515C|nr:hypothetical protein [Actinomadura macra]
MPEGLVPLVDLVRGLVRTVVFLVRNIVPVTVASALGWLGVRYSWAIPLLVLVLTGIGVGVWPEWTVPPSSATWWRECLAAVTYVGKRERGRRLRVLYACMYYAALRPAEAVALHKDDCHLPANGWGRLVLARTLPETGSRWTDSGSTHERRGLKLRPVTEIRTVPIPPVLVQLLREHIAEFGTAPDGRIFQTERGGIVGSTAYGDVWTETRALALTPDQVASP